MDTYTNAKIADELNVSKSTVTRWLDLALQNKNNLQLYNSNGKVQVVYNQHNKAELMRLRQEGAKYRTNTSKKKTKPKSQFGDIYSDEQKLEIWTNLVLESRVNGKYAFLNPQTLNLYQDWYLSFASQTKLSDLNLLGEAIPSTLYRQNNEKLINLIDLNPSSFQPTKFTVDTLASQKYLHSYNPINLSEPVNQLALDQIKTSLPNLRSQVYQKDLETDQFLKCFSEINQAEQEQVNWIFALGHVFARTQNYKNILTNLRSAMQPKDILVFTLGLRTLQNMVSFGESSQTELNTFQSGVLDLLNIDVKKCKISTRYEEETNSKIKNLELDKDYSLELDILGQFKQIDLLGGQKICLQSERLFTLGEVLDICESSQLKINNLSLDLDLNNVLVSCRI